MGTKIADCTSAPATSQAKTCLPCDIPVFCRNNYYRGKLLTERDFTDEQRYHVDKMRLNTLALHGWGVVCGLVVKPHPHCPDLRLLVEEGMAIDDCGREIRLIKEDTILLPQPVTPTVQQGYRVGVGQVIAEPVAAGAADTESGALSTGNSSDSDADDTYPAGNACDPPPAAKDLYICISYAECETEFSPAPFDDCACGTSSQKPNRICEGYKLELYDQKPQFWDKALQEPCELNDCAEYYREPREHCRKPGCHTCLPLAIVYNFIPGQPVTCEQIDNWRPRRRLTSTETLDQIIRCILTKLPTTELTRIEDTNWDHGRRILCRDFMEEYIGTPEHPRGFRIEFSRKVHSGAIDTHSFQVLAALYSDNPSEAQHIQLVPGHIDKDHDETDWCRFRLEPDYARRHLDGRNFDLYLILKCDVITDLHGLAVDGNFIGHRFPTGDHIQGGTFESWILVRPRPRNL